MITKNEKSDIFELSRYDIKSIGLYALSLLSIWLLADTSWLYNLLITYSNQEIANLIIWVISISAKKFLSNYNTK